MNQLKKVEERRHYEPRCKPCNSIYRDRYDRMYLRRTPISKIYEVVLELEPEDNFFSKAALYRHLRRHLKPQKPKFYKAEMMDDSEFLSNDEVFDIMMSVLSRFQSEYFQEDEKAFSDFCIKFKDQWVAYPREKLPSIPTINALYYTTVVIMQKMSQLASEAWAKCFIECLENEYSNYRWNQNDIPYK